MRVLIIDQERKQAEIIRSSLIEQGYGADIVTDEEEGEYLAEGFIYDLIILDVSTDDRLEAYLSSDRKKINVPVLLLAAKDSVQHQDKETEYYLVKPFAVKELLAQVHAILRRDDSIHSPVLRVGDLVMDTFKREVRRGENHIELTGKEYAMLECFMRQPDGVITRGMLEEHIWGTAVERTPELVK